MRLDPGADFPVAIQPGSMFLIFMALAAIIKLDFDLVLQWVAER